jgi:hypothetical protein
MKQLRKLGLKGIDDLTDDDILKCVFEFLNDHFQLLNYVINRWYGI